MKGNWNKGAPLAPKRWTTGSAKGLDRLGTFNFEVYPPPPPHDETGLTEASRQGSVFIRRTWGKCRAAKEGRPEQECGRSVEAEQ